MDKISAPIFSIAVRVKAMTTLGRDSRTATHCSGVGRR
jgi:hypothetical protein